MENLDSIQNWSGQHDNCSAEQETLFLSTSATNDSRFSPNNQSKRLTEASPTKLRPLAPKSLFTERTEYIPLPKISKTKAPHADLKQTVKSILPKPYIFGPKGSSPTKVAALMLKRKATLVCQRKSPVKAKRPNFENIAVSPTFSRVFTRSQGNKVADVSLQESTSKAGHPQAKGPVSSSVEYKGEINKAFECNSSTVFQEEDGEEAEKDEDQMQLDDLMAACTTIRYDPKKSSISHEGDIKSKSQKRRELCLSMLDEDILETDPKKDERDTEYAKDYFNRVKHVLQHDPERFRQFLTTLHEMNKENGNPVKLYAEISLLLHDHQDLMDDFASFLLSHQAVECGCFVSYFQYQQLREFFRKLEIYCDNTTTPFQRTLKILSKLLTPNQEPQLDSGPFKERVASVLKNVPGILDELLDYYLDGQPPNSQSDEFEEVNLESTNRVSEFEEVTLPGGTETYNTKLCGCSCHEDKSDYRFQKRTRHCFSCSLKLDNGFPVLKMSKYEYQPLIVIYPHEEREKLKKAKREAAQLALAKAKAQKSGNKKSKAKGSSHSGKSKGLSMKRKQRRRLPKPRKERTKLFAEEMNSEARPDQAVANVNENSNIKLNAEKESHTTAISSLSTGTETETNVRCSVLEKLDDKQVQIESLHQNQEMPRLEYSSSTCSIITAPSSTTLCISSSSSSSSSSTSSSSSSSSSSSL